MKKLTFIVFIFCFSLKLSFSNVPVWNTYIEEAKDQIRTFIKINNALLKDGKKDEVNYTFVYRPGEKFEFRRPLPKSYISSSVVITDNEWFYDPDDLVPSIDLFNETLVHYNTTSYNDEYRQQFVIVLDVLQNPYFAKSLVVETPTLAPGYVGVTTSTISTTSDEYDTKINQFYDYFISEMNTTFKIDYPQAPDGEEGWGENTMTVLLFAMATLEKTNIVNKTVEPNATSHLNINLKITQMWNTIAGIDLQSPLEIAQNNPVFKDYKNLKGDSPLNIYPGNPLAILASIIQKNISLMFPYSPADLTTCEQFLFKLATEEARTYYTSHCDNAGFDQSYIDELRKSAQAFDFIMYDYNTNGGTGSVSAFFQDAAAAENYIHSKLLDYISTNPTIEFQTFLFNIYDDDSFPVSEKGDFVVKTYYSCFFDLNIADFDDLLINIQSIIQDFVDGKIAKATPIGNSSVDELEKRWTREKRWKRFNEIVNKIKSINVYTNEERQLLLDEFNLNQKVLWDWVITKEYTGLPFGVTGDQIVDNIKDLVLILEPELANLTGDENIFIYDIPSTEYKEEGITYVTNSKGSPISDGVGHIGYTVVEDGNDISFKFESSFCPYGIKQFPSSAGPTSVDCQEDEVRFYLPIENDDANAIGLFDIIYPVKVPYPMHSSDCCFGDATNPCEFYTKPMPAFELAAKIKAKKQDQIELGINVAFSFLGVYGATKGFLAVSSKFARSLAAVYIGSATITAISDIDQLNSSYKHPLAGPSNLQANEFFTTLTKFAILIDLLDGFTSIEKVEEALSSLSSTLLQGDDIVKLGAGAKLLSNVKKYEVPSAGDLADANLHIEILTKIEEDAKTGNTAAAAAIDQKVADFYRLPVSLSKLDKSDNYKKLLHTLYKKVHDLPNVDPQLEEKINGIMNFLESEEKVEKFVDALDGSSDTLYDFFKNTDNVDDMEDKVKLWSAIDDAYPGIPQCVN